VDDANAHHGATDDATATEAFIGALLLLLGFGSLGESDVLSQERFASVRRLSDYRNGERMAKIAAFSGW
jgi:hypothetical protein